VPGPWIDTESVLFDSIDQFVELSDRSADAWTYTVAWIDCLATRGRRVRGVLFRGNHAEGSAAAPRRGMLRWPLTPPISLVNGVSLRAFNALYWRRQRGLAGRGHRIPYGPFFYPLDALLGWNKMYGPRGFYQYQCVVPPPAQVDSICEMLEAIARSGNGSFLGVLKIFGDRKPIGMLSFPMEGITLALDFPNRGEATMRLFERLDDIVRAAGGRLYPAKDARMSKDLFEQGVPRSLEFRRYLDAGLSSRMAERLFGV
jgi:FAD/FMN-containing dehydrogenase